MKITILVDTPQSWIVPYAQTLESNLHSLGHDASLVHAANKIESGDIAFFLSCERIIPVSILRKNKHNLVVHESALPKGKGWSPMTWQVLEGKRKIPVTLFEAAESVDSGVIYAQNSIALTGSELVDELREKQGKATIALALSFVRKYPVIRGKKQSGRATFYPRRKPKDSELDPNKTIAEQFDLLRVVDNERYPAFFKYRGHEYVLKISKRK